MTDRLDREQALGLALDHARPGKRGPDLADGTPTAVPNTADDVVAMARTFERYLSGQDEETNGSIEVDGTVIDGAA